MWEVIRASSWLMCSGGLVAPSNCITGTSGATTRHACPPLPGSQLNGRQHDHCLASSNILFVCGTQGLLGLCIAPFLLVTIPVWWLSWVRDMFRIPEYVAAANRDPSYVVPKKEAIKNGSPPMFSVSRLFAQLFFAWYFHSVFANLKLQLLVGLEVPQIDVAMGLVGCAFGAWMVSCCGDEESPFVNILGATIGCYFMEYHIWGAVLGAQYFRAYRPDFADKRKAGAPSHASAHHLAH